MDRLIFGCGYLGQRVARLWRDAGDSVAVVTRDAGRGERFAQQGFTPLIADVTQPNTLTAVRESPVDTLLYAVGYDRSAEPSIHEVYAEGLRNVLAALPAGTRRVIYISTTGVYGPASGDWVDEQTPPNPLRDGGRASLAAERVLAESPFAARGVVLRLAGIYGPDRVPFLKQLEAGEPIEAPSSGWLNLIHVDDAASVVQRAAAVPAATAEIGVENGSQLYCVSDGAPVLRADYYGEVARQIGADPPAFVAPAADSPRAARAAADKRISNRRLRERLKIELAYPSYREGLASVLGNRSPNG
ncbi:RmlD substrate binding domain protein [Posidoniimonas polymericola]|uniref:RmlD substrate binding domain protein n=1 Tax=Posidoniimonas polymericola TaxID=2528002 RepID=A0A5C5YS41_9BACT|nr:SDR family oxidoreductase [Posidoniimonas polymericola]TWT77739.1 RmlD substrate binding domain protein [Posidoniimonas polymericola]